MDIDAEIARLGAQDFCTLDALIRTWSRLNGDRPAITCEGVSLSWSELDAEVDRAAAFLQTAGLTPGATVAFCAANSTSYVVALLAVLRAGGVVVPLAPGSSAEALAVAIADSGASIMFFDAAAEPVLGQAEIGLGVKRISLDGSREAWMAPQGAGPLDVPISPQSPFNIIYSSGTTGTPKGIVQSHAMRWAHMIAGTPPGYGPDAVTLLSTGLYSNTTLVMLLPALAGGGQVVLMRKFNVAEFLRLSETCGVTHTMLVPVQYQRLLDDPAFATADLSAYQMKFCTSAPLSAALKAQILERWPGGLIEYFGMTEGGATFMLAAHERPDKLHTVGVPLPGHEALIMDDNERPLPPGEIGEIYGCSRTVMTGYHNQPEKTAAAFWQAPDGRQFVRSGDIGYIDEDGFLVVMDRKKDVIISGGFNIYPSDIEHIAAQWPGVRDVTVVGVPSKVWGETAVAFVVADSRERDTFLEFVNTRVGKTQRLADAVFVDDLPRSHIGKVLKTSLRDAYNGQRA